MEWLFLINVGFVFFSGWLAIRCFNQGSVSAGYLNLIASALNAAIVGAKFF